MFVSFAFFFLRLINTTRKGSEGGGACRTERRDSLPVVFLRLCVLEISQKWFTNNRKTLTLDSQEAQQEEANRYVKHQISEPKASPPTLHKIRFGFPPKSRCHILCMVYLDVYYLPIKKHLNSRTGV